MGLQLIFCFETSRKKARISGFKNTWHMIVHSKREWANSKRRFIPDVRSEKSI